MTLIEEVCERARAQYPTISILHIGGYVRFEHQGATRALVFFDGLVNSVRINPFGPPAECILNPTVETVMKALGVGLAPENNRLYGS